MSDDSILVDRWSCDERNRPHCRNSHGCHCFEITSQAARIETLEAENARLIAAQRSPALLYQGAEDLFCTCGAVGSGEGHTDWCPWLETEWAKWGSAFDRADAAESALAEAGWHTFADQPTSGRKFIALYNDGSGASMFFAFDGGVIDSDGDELYDWFSSDHSYDRWAYLPDNLEFWCEVRAEDQVTLSPARAFVQQHEEKK